jgi:aryl-alcohol dehydrogenase-like predicted oxidoreductase
MQKTQLRTAPLGRTGLQITRVGFGAWAIGGGGWQFGWGPQREDEAIAAIHRALGLGVNWIDTAAAYGFGRSEQTVGHALKGLEQRPYVFTKASLLDDGTGHVRHSLRRDSILREAEASLRRLGLDAIDLYQIHWPIPDQDIEEGWAAMAELKEQGLVRHIGVSNFDTEQLRRAQAVAPVETLQPAYSLIDRQAEDRVLPRAARDGIGVIVYSPMGSGRSDPRFTEPQLTRHLALAARLRTVADRHGVAPGAVAVAWTLLNPAVSGAITGFRRPDQVDPILPAADLELTGQDLADLASA